jgi:hypothetical protein
VQVVTSGRLCEIARNCIHVFQVFNNSDDKSESRTVAQYNVFVCVTAVIVHDTDAKMDVLKNKQYSVALSPRANYTH